MPTHGGPPLNPITHAENTSIEPAIVLIFTENTCMPPR
jgi:hypothetical protein